MSHRRILPLVCALLLLTALPVIGEDEVTPAQRYVAKLATLPAPSANLGFDFEGEVFFNGVKLGTCRFGAKPGGESGTMWILTDFMEMKMGADVMREETEATLTANLGLVSGSEKNTKEPDTVHAWKRTETGFEVTSTHTSGDTEVVQVAHTGSALTTMSAAFLFGRFVLGSDGAYETMIFDASRAAKGTEMEKATFEVKGLGDWEGAEALLMKGTRGDKDLLAAYDPDTHAFIGARMSGPGMAITFLPPKEESGENDVDALFVAPPKSSRAVAVQAALAMASGDADATAEHLHWPTLFDEYKVAYPGTDHTIETFREEQMVGLRNNLTPHPREQIVVALKMFAGQIEETKLEGGRVRVKFPPMFRGLTFVVQEFDDVWYVVELPR